MRTGFLADFIYEAEFKNIYKTNAKQKINS